MLWNLTTQACRGDDEPFVVTFQVGKVCTWMHVKSVDPGSADQANEIVIAHHVFCKHYQMPSTHVFALFLQQFVATACYIHFTTEYGLKWFLPLFLTALIEFLATVKKLFYAKHVAVIGNCHSFHSILYGFFHQLVYRALTIEE